MNQLLYKHLRGENYNIFSSGEQKTKNKSIKRIKRTSWQRQCESCVLLPACACLCLRLPVPTWAKWGPTLAAIAACSMGTKIRCVLNIFVYIQTQTTSISSLCVLARACVCVCTRINTYVCMYLDAIVVFLICIFLILFIISGMGLTHLWSFNFNIGDVCFENCGHIIRGEIVFAKYR